MKRLQAATKALNLPPSHEGIRAANGVGVLENSILKPACA